MDSSPITESSHLMMDTPSLGRHAQANDGLTPGPDENAVAGPSHTPVPAAPKRVVKKPKASTEKLLAYTSANVPMLLNVRLPVGDYCSREQNFDVARQVSQARVKKQKTAAENAKIAAEERGEPAEEAQHPLSHTLVIHPGSRNLRFGKASDFYPHEVPFCIARPSAITPRPSLLTRTSEPDDERDAKRRKGENGTTAGHANGDEAIVGDSIDTRIGYLRDYLKEKLRANRLATDWREGTRVKIANGKAKPENIPEHNDPYRFDWTEVGERKWFIGTEALRLPESAGYKVRYPMLNRSLNTRDWATSQSLLDDIGLILEESLKSELDIRQRDFYRYSIVLIVPDHGDRVYVQEMTNLLLSTLGFKEITVHQEAFAAIFSAGLSTACVVDIGAAVTSVTCVDDGLVNQDTRMNLAFGGDDITAALTSIVMKASFPYRDLDLARSQDFLMMDNLKIKICTLEEHLVASTQWDFYVLKPDALTQKYLFRTFDQNILAPLSFFDTRMIDFDGKATPSTKKLWNSSQDVDDMLSSAYGDPTSAMKACALHLLPAPLPPVVEVTSMQANGDTVSQAPSQAPSQANDSPVKASEEGPKAEAVDNSDVLSEIVAEDTKAAPVTTTSTPLLHPVVAESVTTAKDEDIIAEASRIPLDAAIAASIASVATEGKVRTTANTILMIGGGSALKGLAAFVSERLPPLLRAKNLPIQDVHIIPPPRNLNPRFVSWKGASVMCNLESMSDMWIGRDEWEAIGPRALKDRCLFF